MGRIEILTGIERRRDWSDDDKLQILEEAAAAGARIVDVARRHDIHPQQIYTWRRKLAATRTDAVVSFLPVALIAPEPTREAQRPNVADIPITAERSAIPMRIEIGCKVSVRSGRLQGICGFHGDSSSILFGWSENG